jgi:hypothetical protein
MLKYFLLAACAFKNTFLTPRQLLLIIFIFAQRDFAAAAL